VLAGEFLCFSEDHEKEDAKKKFEERLGHAPEQVIERKGLLKVGPVNPADLGDSQIKNKSNS
jgi:hypothetical protein